MDSMDIIRHGKFYSYNGELYANTFPEFWAVHQEPETGTECGNCMTYGSWNGVFCMYCINCADHVYQGTRGGGVYGYIHEGECTERNDYFAAANTYLKNVKMDDIGDREMCDSRAIHGVPEDVVYVMTRYEADSSLNVSSTTVDSADLRAQRDRTARYFDLEEGEIAEWGLPPRPPPVQYTLPNHNDDMNDSETLEFEHYHVIPNETDETEDEDEDDDDYFNHLEEMASNMMVDDFIINHMNFGLDTGEMDNLNLSFIQNDVLEYDEDDPAFDDMPELISVSQSDDELYADMPPLIPL
jgi:hypothetical protein